MRLKVVFAGTSSFAARQLNFLHHYDGVELVGVITQPDRPAGRKYKLQSSPVKLVAQSLGLTIHEPATSGELNLSLPCFESRCDCLIVVAYGQLLPEALLNYPRFGAINLHPSLLPRWRGAAPIQRTIEAGDQISGITLMQLDSGLDTGPILIQREYAVQPAETSGSLEMALGEVAQVALRDLMDSYRKGLPVQAMPQKGAVCYARKVQNEEARLNCAQAADQLVRKIRALNPVPGAYLPYRSGRLKIWDASAVDLSAVESLSPLGPGQIAAISKHSLFLATGKGLLSLLKVQKAGKKVCSIEEFLRGAPHLQVGDSLG